ncbi:MAG: aminotransferase class I/II-fold pyridoxal phosphate-dependent enzyme [Pseudomonadota bacterium]
MPQYSERVNWIAGAGAAAWDIHSKAVQASKTDPDVLVLSVGDPDFDTPTPIVERAVQALRAGDTHYAEVRGREPLRRAIADQMNRLGGPSYGPDNITCLAGTQNALFASSLCLFSAGDEVIVLDPMYVTYEAFLQVSGAKIVRVPCDEETGFRPMASRIAAAVTSKTKAIAFSNPNNPTGVVFTRDQVEAIADIARDHDLWVLSDEVYGPLTFDKPHVAIAGLPDMAERTVTVSGLSKSHAMTGWRVGWVAGPTEFADHVDNLALCMLYGLPGFIQEAATLALNTVDDAVSHMRDMYRARRDLVAAALNDVPGLDVVVPDAGMFVLVDVRGTGRTALEFSRDLYDAKKVSTLDGGAFGANAAGFIRLSFARREDELSHACGRIADFVAEIA